jgi:hypothetical protein
VSFGSIFLWPAGISSNGEHCDIWQVETNSLSPRSMVRVVSPMAGLVIEQIFDSSACVMQVGEIVEQPANSRAAGRRSRAG